MLKVFDGKLLRLVRRVASFVAFTLTGNIKFELLSAARLYELRLRFTITVAAQLGLLME